MPLELLSMNCSISTCQSIRKASCVGKSYLNQLKNQKTFANANSYCYYNHQIQRVVVCFFLYQILGDTQRPWKGVIRCMSVSVMMSKTHKLKPRSPLASAAWKDCKIRYLSAHAVAAVSQWCRICSMSITKMPSPSMWWQADWPW